MLSWHYITSENYKSLTPDAEGLYFLKDTKQIYRGTELFTEAVVFLTTTGAWPTTPAVGKIYVDPDTLEGKVYTGVEWKVVIKAVTKTLTATDESAPVSGKAVADYVGTEIAKVTGSNGLVANVEYVEASNSLKVTMADGVTIEDIPMTNVAADLVYNKDTGLLQVKNAAGTTIGEGINLDLERFVSSASYDHETGTITLVFNDDQNPLEIEIGDLVDTYTAANSTTIALSVTGNEFVAEAIVSATEGNQLVATDNGLFVAAQDISGKADKVAPATANSVALLAADGNLADSKVTVGGASVGETASASVLATEAAVAAIRDALNNAINLKMDKVGADHGDEIIIADATGNAVASGKKLGGATLSATPDANTMATEAAVNTALTAALTWNTTT